MQRLFAVTAAGAAILMTHSFYTNNPITSNAASAPPPPPPPPPPLSPSPSPAIQTNPNIIPPNELTRFGFPSNENLRYRAGYVLSYNTKHKTANWVLEVLTPERNALKNADRKLCEFVVDDSVHEFFRSINADYKGSGYDRGHLANAANQRWAQSAMCDTFFLSNMSPQVGKGFNRDIWNKLEQWVRSLGSMYNRVTICTGPLFLPTRQADGKSYIQYEVIGANQVAVPTHFFKAVVCEPRNGPPEIMAFIMPNGVTVDGTPLSQFLVPLDRIERAAGFLLFERMGDQRYKLVLRDGQGRLIMRETPQSK